MALEALRGLLLRVVADIDAGSSNMTEDEELRVVRLLRRYTCKDARLSKAQCCELLGVSRATFDRMVRDGRMPHGTKTTGFKELSWNLREVEKAAKECGRSR